MCETNQAWEALWQQPSPAAQQSLPFLALHAVASLPQHALPFLAAHCLPDLPAQQFIAVCASLLSLLQQVAFLPWQQDIVFDAWVPLS